MRLCILLLLSVLIACPAPVALAEAVYPPELAEIAPVYPFAEVTQTMYLAKGVVATLTCMGSFDDVMTFYRLKMTELRWKMVTELDEPEHRSAAYASRSQRLIVDVSLDETSSKTLVRLTLTSVK